MQTTERSNLGTIALLIVSGLGLVASLFGAALLLLVGLVGLFGQAMMLNDLVAVFALAWISFLIGALGLPAVILSTLRLLGRELRLPIAKLTTGSSFRLASVLLFLWPLALAAGNYVAGMNSIAWLLLPPLHLLAIGLPIWWLVELARRGLPAGSPQRGWGILSTSLFVTTPSVVVIELLGLLILILAAVAIVSVVPEWLSAMERLAERLALLENNPQAAMQTLQVFFDNPAALFGLLSILAIIVPMMEEFFKPLAVWFLLGRQITEAEGFAAGAICGGAFALLESLMTISSQNEGWAGLAVARAGTGLLHITTTALMGWALASAWRGRAAGCASYLRLGAAYLLAVTLHGMWNALSIIFSVGSLFGSPPPAIGWLLRLAPAAPLALLALVVGLFTFLWSSNRRLRGNIQEHIS